MLSGSCDEKHGERPEAQEYRGRFPEYDAAVRAVFGAAPRADGGAAARPASDTGRNLSSASWPFKTTLSVATSCWPPSPPGSPTRLGRWPRSWWIEGCSTSPAVHCLRPWSPSTSSSTEVTRRRALQPSALWARCAMTWGGSATPTSRPAWPLRPPGLLPTPRRRRTTTPPRPAAPGAVPHPPLPPRGRAGPRVRRSRRGARP